MPSVWVVRWEKVADVSPETAEELLENLRESETTYPYYIDEEDYNKLSERARSELKELGKRFENGEVLEIVFV